MSAPGSSSELDRGSRAGQVLSDKYRLARRLGRGGMGEVYEAEHALVGRRVAIKFLRPELATDQEMMRRFRREAKSAGSLVHENIVAVTDFGHADDGSPYIVMEYLEGENLGALLARSGPLPIGRAVRLLVQACRGLQAAHDQHIVHRDLKPENLFVTKRSDGSDLVKVLDFGIAKLRGETTSGISTKAGAIIGTLPYMPSEQLRGEKETDHRADVYALGAILYEAIAGRVPHAGSNVQAIMYRILHEDAQDLDTLRPETPHALALVVRKALAREAADRYQTVTELGAALAPFGEHASEPVRTTPFLPPSDTAPTPISVIQEVIEQPAPRQRGRTWTITALLVAALVILAAVWKLRMLDDTKPDPNAQAPGREQELAPPAHERSTIKQPEVPAAGADAKASTSPGSTQPDPSPGPEAPAGRPDGPTDTPDGRKPRKDTPATTKPSKSEPANRPVVIDRKNPYG